MIIYNYIIFLGLLTQICSQPQEQFDRYKKPYISAIYIGTGIKTLVNPSSTITPHRAFMTSTSTELTISLEDTVLINSDDNENNITMEFSFTDFEMEDLFEDITYIKKVDLSNFNIKPSSIKNMFSGCRNLEEIIFGDFDTSRITSMAGLFKETKVTSLDLSSFNTYNVEDMSYMFDDCKNLKYLNLENFDYSKVTNALKMLNDCQNSLVYLNIFSYKDGDTFDSDFLDSANKDLIFCINKEIAPILSSSLLNNNYVINCSFILIEEKSSTSTDNLLPSEFKSTYPNFNIKTTEIDNKENIIHTTQKEIIEIKKTSSIEDCSAEDLFSNKCGNGNQTLSVESKDNLINNIINDIINGNLENILDSLINGEEDDLIIKEDDVIFQLTTTENQNENEYNNISSINLGNCETILRNTYSIPENLSLIILKVDYFIEEFNIPIIGYEVFHPLTKIRLNLSLCDNTTVTYNIPVDIDEEDLDKYNTSSDYYNDECSVYTTDDGTDIIISDRKQEYNDNNMFLCESNCNYTNYNSTTKKSVCNCEVNSKIYSISEIISNKDSISQNFDVNSTSSSGSNLSLMKCVDTLFSKYGILKNLEFYILIIMAFLYTGSGIFFYRMGYPLLENDIREILDNKYENNSKKRKITKKFKTPKIKKKSNGSKGVVPDVNENVSNPKKKKRNLTAIKHQNLNNPKNTINAENYNKSVSKIKVMNNNENNNENNKIDIIDNPANTNDQPNIKDLTIYELNNLSYQDALLVDRRKMLQYYFSLIRTKHPLFFSFVPINDYNSLIIKIDLFILNFAICSAINALFFTQSTIHKIYKDKGKYDFGFFISKIIASFFISHFIILAIKYFILTERNIVNIKKKPNYDEAYDEADNTKRCLIIKCIIFYAVGLAFLILFWYYLSSFCAVYQNTQIFLIINTFISLGISFLYPFIFNFIPAFLRKVSLSKSNYECIYKTSKIIQIL